MVLKLGTALPILEMIYSVAVNYWTDQYLGYLIVYRTIVNTICFIHAQVVGRQGGAKFLAVRGGRKFFRQFGGRRRIF